jgi:hemerythrin-like domain-containing protein
VQAVLRLQQDHDWLEEDWMALSPHLAAIAAGQSWWEVESLRDGVSVFSALLRDHIALEESLIYPQARQRLQGMQRRDMGREMAARRTRPDRPRLTLDRHRRRTDMLERLDRLVATATWLD